MIQAHYAAFKQLLTVAPDPLTVYDAQSVNLASGMYVTLYPDSGDRVPVDLADDNPLKRWTIRTTVTGETLDQVNRGMEMVEARLNNIRPVVAGHTCTRIKKILTRLAERDDAADPACFYAVADWRWQSIPTTT